MGAVVRAAEKAVGGGEPLTCWGAALCRSPAFPTSGQSVPMWEKPEKGLSKAYLFVPQEGVIIYI